MILLRKVGPDDPHGLFQPDRLWFYDNRKHLVESQPIYYPSIKCMSGQWGNLPCLCRQQIRKHFLREKIKILALQERYIRWFKVLQSLFGWLFLSRGSPDVPEKMASVLQVLKRETDWKTTKQKWKSKKFAAQKWKKQNKSKQKFTWRTRSHIVILFLTYIFPA